MSMFPCCSTFVVKICFECLELSHCRSSSCTGPVRGTRGNPGPGHAATRGEGTPLGGAGPMVRRWVDIMVSWRVKSAKPVWYFWLLYSTFGWWMLVVTGTWLDYFSIYWEFHHHNWLIFFREVETTNQTYIYYWYLERWSTDSLTFRPNAKDSTGYPVFRVCLLVGFTFDWRFATCAIIIISTPSANI